MSGLSSARDFPAFAAEVGDAAPRHPLAAIEDQAAEQGDLLGREGKPRRRHLGGDLGAVPGERSTVPVVVEAGAVLVEAEVGLDALAGGEPDLVGDPPVGRRNQLRVVLQDAPDGRDLGDPHQVLAGHAHFGPAEDRQGPASLLDGEVRLDQQECGQQGTRHANLVPPPVRVLEVVAQPVVEAAQNRPMQGLVAVQLRPRRPVSPSQGGDVA